jgi:flagellar hook-associated protein 1 FlgK
MSLSLALDSALSGLITAQRQTALTSRNIANAATPGYTRKEAELQALTIQGEGRGVTVAQVVRKVDKMLQQDTRRESGLSAELQAKAEGLASFTTAIGQPDEERSLSSQIAKLSQAFQRLGESPENAVIQHSVVGAAQGVARSLNDLASAVRDQRQAADQGIADSVASVNQSLDDLAHINEQLSVVGGAGRDVTDLLDQRDKLLDSLSQELGITALTRGDGQTMVLTEGGTTLLDGSKINHLAFSTTTTIGAASAYNAGAGPLSGVTVNGQDISPGSGYPGAIRSGRMAGEFALRDTILPQAQAQIDEIASTLADGFQRADASVAAGQAGLFTDNGAAHDRSDPAQVTGLSERIAVNALVDPDQGGSLWRIRDGIQAAAPGAPGDATQVRAFLGVFDEAVSFSAGAGLSTSARIGAYATEFVGYQDNQRAAFEERASYQGSIADSLNTQRTNLEGVNVDDEMQKLLLFEQTYNASAKVIQAVRDMMDTLMDI